MRKHMVMSIGMVSAVLAAVGLGDTVISNVGEPLYPEPSAHSQFRRRAPKRVTGFHPNINRWTGKPHEHAAEIARRKRQEAAR